LHSLSQQFQHFSYEHQLRKAHSVFKQCSELQNVHQLQQQMI